MTLRELRDQRQAEYEHLRARARGEVPTPRYGLSPGDEILHALRDKVWHEVMALDEAIVFVRGGR
jgi:hypothetical protein